MKYFILVPILLMLTSCANMMDDYSKYSTALKDHSKYESQRISSQSTAIADAAKVVGATKTESILLSVIAQMNIQSLKPVRLNIKDPVTGYKVLNTLAGHVPFMATTYGMLRLGEAGLNAAGNVTADTINANDSFNDTETRATGRSNTVSSTQRPTAIEGEKASSDHSNFVEQRDESVIENINEPTETQ